MGRGTWKLWRLTILIWCREFSAGLAEVIKYGFIRDPEFLDWLDSHMDALLARDAEPLTHAIERSCWNKAEVVASDERETGDMRALLNFAKAFKYEEVVAALAMMTGVKITTLDKLIDGDRYDPILIACKVLGFEWATARALIVMRLGPNRAASPADIEGARVNFTRLMPSTAQRVVDFWKTR